MAAIKELSRLEEVELREIWPDEAQNFTPWLAEEENLDLLSETLDMALELEGQELNVGDFRADILCRNTEDNSRVLIENQLERTDHNHLGQILTYSASLDIHTVIWIAKEFREEHRAALDRLNEITNENFQCFGIEVKVWQIGNSAHAPQFEIVSKPNDWNRTVTRDTERAVSENLTERQLQNIKFWTELRDYMNQKSSQLQPRKRKRTSFLVFDIGRMSFAMAAWRDRRRGLGVEVYMTGKNALAHFHLLKEQREKIESEFGKSLEWQEERRNVILWLNDVNLTDERDWFNQCEWVASKLELFNKVFRPHIKALNAADWEHPEDEDET